MPSKSRIFVVLIPLFFSLACLVLGALAISGSTVKNRADTYMFMLNLTEVKTTSFLGSSNAASQSNWGSDSTPVTQYGLSEIYTFGLWGYCKGTSTDGAYKVTHCSTPKPFYEINPIAALTDDLSASTLTVSDKIDDSLKTLKITSKVIFITSIVGVALSFISSLTTAFSFSSHCLSCIGLVLGCIGVASMLIAAGASTGSFILMKNAFDDTEDAFGWIAGFGNYQFYGFIWGSAAAFLLANFFNLLAICCGSTRSHKYDKESEPAMVFEEKSFADSDSDHSHH